MHSTGFLLDQAVPVVVHNPNPKKDRVMPVPALETRETRDLEVYTYQSTSSHLKELYPVNLRERLHSETPIRLSPRGSSVHPLYVAYKLSKVSIPLVQIPFVEESAQIRC
jgi:hypothetical protein